MASELVSLFEQKMVIQNKTIDSLPIEMLRAVLINVEGKPLILARRVSRQWLNVIGHICKGKTSLVLQSNDSIYQIGNNPLSYLFNGLVNFSKNCAVLKTESDPLALSYNFSHLLAKLFPRVQCLAIIGSLDGTTAKCLFALLALWSSTITSLRLPYISDSHRAAFVGQIAKLSALKRLDVHLIDDCLEPTTLAQLEHFTYYYNAPTVFARLGPGCTSLHLTGRTFSSTITRMFSDNAALVNGLTHLKVRIEQFDGLSIICSNFVALQMLDIAFEDRSGFDAESIALFAKLTKLTQLSINNFAIDFTLARVDLAVLPLVRILEMKDVTFFSFQFKL